MARIPLLLATFLLACGQSAAVRSPGEPPPLSHQEIEEGMQTALRRVQACPAGPPGTALPVIKVTVDASGRITEARTVGPTSVTPTASCIEREVRLVRFRANPGVRFDYMFPLE